MKNIFLAIGMFSATATAELPVMSDNTTWLGYFTAWEGRAFDFGIGADGNSAMIPKKGRDQMPVQNIKVQYFIEEEINGRWTRRKIATDDGLSSQNEKGMDPDQAVVIVTKFTGDTSVEWTHEVSRHEVKVVPRLIEKTSTNAIRVGVELALPNLYRFTTGAEDKEIESKVKGDTLTGIRKKDGKKVRLRFNDLKADPNTEENFSDGAVEIEVVTDGIKGRILNTKTAGKDSGQITVETKGPLYRSFRLKWVADFDRLGEKDNAFIFGMK